MAVGGSVSAHDPVWVRPYFLFDYSNINIWMYKAGVFSLIEIVLFQLNSQWVNVRFWLLIVFEWQLWLSIPFEGHFTGTNFERLIYSLPTNSIYFLNSGFAILIFILLDCWTRKAVSTGKNVDYCSIWYQLKMWHHLEVWWNVFPNFPFCREMTLTSKWIDLDR